MDTLRESECAFMYTREGVEEMKLGQEERVVPRDHRRCVDNIIIKKVSATSSFSIQSEFEV